MTQKSNYRVSILTDRDGYFTISGDVDSYTGTLEAVADHLRREIKKAAELPWPVGTVLKYVQDGASERSYLIEVVDRHEPGGRYFNGRFLTKPLSGFEKGELSLFVLNLKGVERWEVVL